MKEESNRRRIIAELERQMGSYISGGQLSKELGISRTAIWKRIKHLREAGYLIDAAPNKGYCLVERPDLLEKDSISDAGVYYMETIDSTNRQARTIAENEQDELRIIIAEEQTAGRGRLDRTWHSPAEKGLWFSMILKPQKLIPADAAAITLCIGAATASFLEKHSEEKINIKWPNDLLLNGKKLGGILTEIKADLDRIHYIIVGIGLNINSTPDDFPPTLRDKATSLRNESTRTYNRTRLFLGLAENLKESCQIFYNEGFKAFHDLWIKHNCTIGREVNITWPGGGLIGKAIDISDRGELIVRDMAGSVHHIGYGVIS